MGCGFEDHQVLAWRRQPAFHFRGPGRAETGSGSAYGEFESNRRFCSAARLVHELAHQAIPGRRKNMLMGDR